MTSSTGEHGTLIMIIVFFGMFGILIATLPATILVNQENTSNINFPTVFKIGGNSFSNYTTGVMNRDNAWHLFALNYGEDFQLCYSWDSSGIVYRLGLPPPYPGSLIEPVPVTRALIMAGKNNSTHSDLLLTIPSGVYPPITALYSNSTGYSTIETSFDAGNMTYFLGYPVNVTREATSYDVWKVVSQIMNFKTPDVHPVLNFIIGLTLWAPIIVAIIYVLDKLLPF